MMWNRKLMHAYLISLFSIVILMLSNLGCGGGANDDFNENPVFIQVSVEAPEGDGASSDDYFDVEMYHDVHATLAQMSISASAVLSNVDPATGTVVMDRYELAFQRVDGGSPTLLPTLTGPIDITVEVDGDTEVMLFPVVTTHEKVYGELGQFFAANPRDSLEFQCTLTVYGHTLVGESLSASTGFHILCAIFLPHDDLYPSIVTFANADRITAGDSWYATWSVLGTVSYGQLTTPFGDQLALSAFDFPAGYYTMSTSFLESQVPSGSAMTYPAPILIVSNPFGIATESGDPVTVTGPPAEPPDTEPVGIEEFYASDYNLTLSQSTNLNWVCTGNPTQLQMMPAAFNGVPVDFTGKNLSFDSVTVVPESSVRPVLRALKSTNGTEAHQFLDQEISVSGGVGPQNPTIDFFTVSHTDVALYQQVAFFWKISGDYEKVELFPIYGQPKEVTGRESYLSPPLNKLGNNSFSLIVTGVGGGPIVKADVSVDVSEEIVNQPPEISLISQAPSSSIDNLDQGAFCFRIDDPENRDCSWRVSLLAGDRALYGPNTGRIYGGHGEDCVSFQDLEDAGSGFLTFEISAWDDDNFGNSNLTNKSVLLVTYDTTGADTNDAPVISDVTFTPGNLGDGLLPGQDGVISFNIADPNTNSLYWEVSIIAGDRDGWLDGVLNRTEGIINGGSAAIAVHYQDDPDSTDDAVVFKIFVEERNEAEPLSAVAILRVDYLTDTDGTIFFAHNGLYNNGSGIIDPNERLAFYLNYTGTTTTVPGAFFEDHDLLIPAPALSVILDLQHGSEDAGRIAHCTFTRDFVSPYYDNENYGEFQFAGYFETPGQHTAAGSLPEPDPDANNVSRWYFTFNVESFRADTGSTYNLPIIDGQLRNYQILVTAFDEDNTEEDLTMLLQVENVH